MIKGESPEDAYLLALKDDGPYVNTEFHTWAVPLWILGNLRIFSGKALRYKGGAAQQIKISRSTEAKKETK